MCNNQSDVPLDVRVRLTSPVPLQPVLDELNRNCRAATARHEPARRKREMEQTAPEQSLSTVYAVDAQNTCKQRAKEAWQAARMCLNRNAPQV